MNEQTTENGRVSDKLDSLVRLLMDINSQATRKNRAVSLKKYLIFDLDYIAKISQQAIDKILKAT